MKFGAEKYVTSRVQRGKGMQVKWNEGLKYQRLLCCYTRGTGALSNYLGKPTLKGKKKHTRRDSII